LGLVVAGRKTNKQTKKSKKEFQICVPFYYVDVVYWCDQQEKETRNTAF
jgi:hypothetical protein